MGEPVTPTRQQRLSMSSGMRSSSFLQEHQQYRPPSKPEGYYGIDSVVQHVRDTHITLTPPRQISPFKGIPSPENPPTIVESGLSHELCHPNCTRAPSLEPGSEPGKLIATLFYKSMAPRVSNAIPSSHKLPSPGLPAAECSDIPPNMAPSSSLDTFPLEPPAAEPEPLDHLYGSHISSMCIASFLHLMSTFPLPSNSTHVASAHRCLGLDRAHEEQPPLVVELTFSPAPSPSYLSLHDLRKHELIYRFEREWNVDVALQPDTVWRRYPRLVVFDMDSTLIREEVIDLLAATAAGPPDLAVRVADITHRAMVGDLEFEAAFRERVALLRGMPDTVFRDLRPQVTVTRGVRQLIVALKRLGVRTAVLSGGFRPLTEWLARELGIDHAHANEVATDPTSRTLTGEVSGLIVGKERKRDLLLDIAAKEGIAREQIVAVGDGANDLLMMEAAGLGVAWNAKPRVQMEADVRLNSESLLHLLYLFGFTDEEIELLAKE